MTEPLDPTESPYFIRSDHPILFPHNFLPCHAAYPAAWHHAEPHRPVAAGNQWEVSPTCLWRHYLVGGDLTILKNISQWEGWHPIYEMENTPNVPNHQPVENRPWVKKNNELWKIMVNDVPSTSKNAWKTWSDIWAILEMSCFPSGASFSGNRNRYPMGSRTKQLAPPCTNKRSWSSVSWWLERCPWDFFSFGEVGCCQPT